MIRNWLKIQKCIKVCANFLLCVKDLREKFTYVWIVEVNYTSTKPWLFWHSISRQSLVFYFKLQGSVMLTNWSVTVFEMIKGMQICSDWDKHNFAKHNLREHAYWFFMQNLSILPLDISFDTSLKIIHGNKLNCNLATLLRLNMQGLSVPFACVGSGDPVRVLRLYTTNTLDILWSIYCWDICTTCR